MRSNQSFPTSTYPSSQASWPPVETGRRQAIAEAIKQSKSPLTTLNLSGNLIGGVGASAIAKAIKQSQSLTAVNLGDNTICAFGAKDIAERPSSRVSR